MRHFEPHAPYKAVKSYATRAELVCSRRPTNHRLFATFGIVNEACIFAHFHHYDEEEARAHTARKVDKKWGSDIARRTTQTRFSFVADSVWRNTRAGMPEITRNSCCDWWKTRRSPPHNGFLLRNMLIGGVKARTWASIYEFLDRGIFIPFRVFDRISSGWTNEWIGAGKDLPPWEEFYFSWIVSSIRLSFFFKK